MTSEPLPPPRSWPRALDLVVPAAGALLFLFAPQSFNRLLILGATLLLWIGLHLFLASRIWHTCAPEAKRATFKRLLLTASILVFFGLLFVADAVLARRNTVDLEGGLPFLGNNSPGLEIHTLVPYPYSGFHIRPNVHLKGPMPLEQTAIYDKFDIRSGDHGFFIDFDLDNPPAKEPNEFRIILIGGSAAHGFGAQTNNHMLYRVLERLLNEQLRATGLRIRVINMAMANSLTYQNFVMLNRWGHQLQPDLILSFSGSNDCENPSETGTDMPLRFEGIWGMTRGTWVTENHPLIDDLLKPFPAINASLPAIALRTLRAPTLATRARAEYSNSFQYEGALTKGKMSANFYIQALRSIKRDFLGIPIFVALQPVKGYIAPGRNQDLYRTWFANARLNLGRYKNDLWYFANVHEHFLQENLFGTIYLTNDGVHLTNAGQQAVAKFLSPQLVPVITSIVQSRAKAAAQ